MILSHSIYDRTAELPADWDAVAADNIFLSRAYLKVLEDSAPDNMQCFFIGLTDAHALAGVAICQFLNLTDVSSFGERDSCFKRKVRDFFFRRFTAHVLMAGNNMLTGPNTFRLKPDVDQAAAFAAIDRALSEISSALKAKGTSPHLIIWKDFRIDTPKDAVIPGASKYFRFTTQPNMVFDIRPYWNDERDYVADLNKKYRDQYKRARRKNDGVTMRKLSLDDIRQAQDDIYRLYMTVAGNAPFNTFWLSRRHFVSLKENLDGNFLLYGYYLDGKLIGFDTLIKNGTSMDTYFLGYDETVQREKMLYLNMLYNMIAYSIKKRFKKVVFARTALEIKSSVGAYPVGLYGYIRHTNPLLNAFMPRLFRYFEPEMQWHRRHPFRDAEPQSGSV